MTPPEHAPTVVVLAGGRSTRFGTDKLAAELDGVSLLDHLLAALPRAWPLVLVGPTRRTVRPDAVWVREDPPSSGPLAAVAAGVAAAATGAVVVVAGDMPWAAGALEPLVSRLDTSPDFDAVVAVDDEGRVNPLLAAYRTAAVRTLLADGTDGRAMRLLELRHERLHVAGAAGRDVDRPADLG